MGIILLNIMPCQTTKIMLSAKIENKTTKYLEKEYFLIKSYKKFLSLTSVAVYALDTNGYMTTVNTSSDWKAIDYQFDVGKIGYLKMPLIYCDSTWGLCSPLSIALNAAIKRGDQFIADSIYHAKYYGWNGYTVDFELTDQVDINYITKFMIKWSNALHMHNLQLIVWVGGPVPYNMKILFNNINMYFITMYTYNTCTYEGFIASATMFLNYYTGLTGSYNYSNIGFGIIANDVFTSNDILVICKWCESNGIGILSFFSDTINKNWHEYLEICKE